ncbi:hypothetical protein [Thiolapillus sp.]|uniref:hypothetical protein n=4 Tax=Thiolapillus sp. TaxID=2017437 RepID=UPI0025F0C426|nr:hypothetical protein [Thiolapillus sp.]
MNRILFVLLAVTSCSNSDYYQFGTDGRPLLCVPSQEMDQNTLPDNHEMLNLFIGKGRKPGFGFYFSGKYLRKRIPGFVIRKEFSGHPYVNALSGSIGILGDTENLGHFNSSVYAWNTKDMWYATGECKNPNIEHIEDADLYRVKCKKGDDYANIWNKIPGGDMLLPSPADLVVATCRYEDIEIGPYAGREYRKCRRVFATIQYQVDYYIQEDNLSVVEELDEFIKERIQTWQDNCSLKEM